MIKRYSIVLLLFVMISCKSKEEKMFFDFDSIEYYSLKKTAEEQIRKNYQKDITDSIFDNVFYKDYPKELNDSVFYRRINLDEFSKFELSKNDIEYLRNDVFIEKLSLKIFDARYACVPEYRDILVFKKKNQISGIAKICLSCRQFYFISSKKEIDTEDFGTEKEFKFLRKLFDTYKKDKE